MCVCVHVEREREEDREAIFEFLYKRFIVNVQMSYQTKKCLIKNVIIIHNVHF